MPDKLIPMKGSLKCPVCKYKKARVYRYLTDFGGRTMRWLFFIECAQCETSSCEYLSEEAAISAWIGEHDPSLLHALFPDVEDVSSLPQCD